MIGVTYTRPCPEGHKEPVAQGDGSGWNEHVYHTPPCSVCDDRCEVSTLIVMPHLPDVRRYVISLLWVLAPDSTYQPLRDAVQAWTEETNEVTGLPGVTISTAPLGQNPVAVTPPQP